LLIFPMDAKPDNFILVPFVDRHGLDRYRLVCIDNDQSFSLQVALLFFFLFFCYSSSQATKKTDGNILRPVVKCILFVMNQANRYVNPFIPPVEITTVTDCECAFTGRPLHPMAVSRWYWVVALSLL